MIYKLGKKTIEKLLTLPESGIGYQLIKAKKDGKSISKNFVVFNSEIAIENDEKLKNYSNTLIGQGYRLLLQMLQTIELNDITLMIWDENNDPAWGQASLNIESDKQKLKEQDIYIRPSIYENDYRIDLKKEVLLPGSYVTTLESYTNCHIMREDPFDKYTLPVQQEFVKIYYVKQQGVELNTDGIFEQAFGKHGGGVKLNFNTYGKVLVKREKEQ